MDSQTSFVALCDILAELYPTEVDTRAVVADAGLDAKRIVFSSHAQTTWRNILDEAISRQCLDKLLEIVLSTYSSNPSLASTYRQYRLFIDQGGLPQPPDQLPVGGNTLQIIKTGGGTHVTGDINIDEGNFIGRDEIIHGDKVYGDKVIGDKFVHIHRADDAYDVQGLPNPYLGLSSFSYEDRSRYAGREGGVRKAVELLTTPGEQRTLLFITGASGSGKSSFAQAGLLPALETYYTERNQDVRWAVLRPSRQPLISFADGLLRLGIAIEGPSSDRGKQMWKVLTGLDRANQIGLLVIDQFEEIFQAVPSQRDSLCELLEALPEFAELRVHMIAALRIDYLPHLFARKTLFDIAKQGIELRAMSVDELQLAIQRPLQEAFPRGEKRFERALVEKLANESVSDAAYLPLLQVTLEDLWRRGRLQLSEYGNLTDAIEQRAEHIYNYFDDATGRRALRSDVERDTILKTFLNLVRVSLNDDDQHDVRRYRPVIELTQGKPDHEKLIEELVNSRLLSKNLETQLDSGKEITIVDIIHESLIMNWKRLRDAIADKRGVLQQRTRFEQSLSEWLNSGRNEQYLLEGIRLAEAESLSKHDDFIFRNAEAQLILNQSIKRRENRRLRNQRLALGVIASLLVMLVVAIGGWGLARDAWQDAKIAADAEAKQSQELEEQNKILIARNLVAQARQVEYEDPLLALRLVLEAMAWLPPDSKMGDRRLQEELLRGYLTRGIIARYTGSSVPTTQYLSPNLAILDYRHENHDASNPIEIHNIVNGELIDAPRGNLTALSYQEGSLASLLVNFDFPGLQHESTLAQIEQHSDTGAPIIHSIDGADYFVVQYSTSNGELRHKANNSVLNIFPDAIAQIRTVPGLAYFIVDFVAPKLDLVQEQSELRNKSDGSLLEKLPGKVDGILTEKDPSNAVEPLPYFVLNYEHTTSELRQMADGALVASLPSKASAFAQISDNSSYFTVSYEDGLHEVRRRDDGSLFIGEQYNAVYQLHNVSDEVPYFVVRYDSAPSELRRKSDGSLFASPLPPRIEDIHSLGESPYFLIDYANQRGELRKKVDGSWVAQLGGMLTYQFNYHNLDKTSSYLLLDYEGETSGEILNLESGTIVETLAGNIDRKERDVIKNAPYFILTYQIPQNGQGEYVRSELRRKDNGSRVERLAGTVSKIYPEQTFSPYFMLAYADAPGELRSSVDGALMDILTGTIENVAYASGNSSFQLTSDLYGPSLGYFILDYVDKPGELRNFADGTPIGPLKGEISAIHSSSGQESTFVLQYEDQPGELRKKADGSLFKTLTDTVSSVLWMPPHFVIHYKDADDELYSSIDSSLLLTLPKKVTEIRELDSCLQVKFTDGSSEALFPLKGRAFPIPQRLLSRGNLSCFAGKTSYFIVAQNNGVAEIVSSADSSVVQQFGGTGMELYLLGNSLPFFVVDYRDAPDELRNAEDAAFVEKLKGEVSIAAPIGEAGSHFIIAYAGDTLGELRRSLDGGIDKYFPHVFAEYWPHSYLSYEHSNKLPFFVVRYIDAPAELRSQENGALIESLADDTYWLRSVSQDSPYFLLMAQNDFAKLYRKRDGAFLDKLPGKGEPRVVESLPPYTPYWIFDFEEVSGQLRSVEDGSLLQVLSGDVDRIMRLDERISYFVLDYVNKPSELRNLTDGSFLLSLTGNISNVHQLENSYFLVDYVDAKSELRRAADGSLLQQLDGNISALWRTDGVQPLGSNVRTGQQGTTPNFLIDYADAKSELRRAADGALLQQLDGRLSEVWKPQGGKYIGLHYEDAPGELRSIEDGALLRKLSGIVQKMHETGGVSYFIVQYAYTPGELRSIEDGALLRELKGRIDSVILELDQSRFPFLKNYFLVNYVDARAELWRKSSGMLVQQLNGSVEQISPSNRDIPFYVMNYADAPDELRSIVNHSIVAQLTHEASLIETMEGHENSEDKGAYFVLNYENSEFSDLRRKSDGSLVGQINKDFETITQRNATDPYLLVSYQDRPNELRSVADPSLITSAVESYRNFAIGNVEYVLVKKENQIWEIWQAAPAKLLVTLGTRSQEPPDSIYVAQQTEGSIQNKLFWDWHEGMVEIIDLDWLTVVWGDPQNLQDEQLLQAACVPFHVHRFNESILAREQYLGTLEPRACRSEFNGKPTQFPIQIVSPLTTSPLATPTLELGKQCSLIIYVLDQETNEAIIGATVQIMMGSTSSTGKTRTDGDYRISNLCSDSDLSKIQVEAAGYDSYTRDMPSLVGNYIEIWLSKSPPTPTRPWIPTTTPTVTLSGSE